MFSVFPKDCKLNDGSDCSCSNLALAVARYSTATLK